MITFLVSLKWTDKGIREIKDTPNRVKTGREIAKKVGIEIKHIYLTQGDRDVLLVIDAPNGDAVAKFCLAVGSLGNEHCSGVARGGIPEVSFRAAINAKSSLNVESTEAALVGGLFHFANRTCTTKKRARALLSLRRSLLVRTSQLYSFANTGRGFNNSMEPRYEYGFH